MDTACAHTSNWIELVIDNFNLSLFRKRQRDEEEAEQEKAKREKQWKEQWDVCEYTMYHTPNLGCMWLEMIFVFFRYSRIALSALTVGGASKPANRKRKGSHPSNHPSSNRNKEIKNRILTYMHSKHTHTSFVSVVFVWLL